MTSTNSYWDQLQSEFGPNGMGETPVATLRASGDSTGATDLANLTTMCANFATSGGSIQLPHDVIYLPPGAGGVPALTVPGGVTLLGSTIDYSASSSSESAGGPPSRGSIIRAAAGTWTGPLVRFGAVAYPTTGWNSPGNTGGGSSFVIFDAGTLATSAVQTWGARSFHFASQFWGGTAEPCDASGQNSRFRDCVAEGQAASPYALQINAHDVKWLGGEVRCATTAQCLITAVGENFIFQPDDCYSAVSDWTATSDGVLIQIPASTTGIILGTIGGRIDCVANVVHVIVGASSSCYNLQVTGLHTYVATGWLVLVDVSASGSSFSGLLINGTQDGYGTPTLNHGLAGLVALHSSIGSVPSSVVRNNQYYGKQLYGGGFLPTLGGGNSYFNIQTGFTIGAVYQDEQRGIGSATGAVNTVTVAHAINTSPAPRNVSISPSSLAAVGAWVSSVTATNFVVTFAAQPGASTATFNWQASY